MSKNTRTLTPTTIVEQGRPANIAYFKEEMNEVARAEYLDDHGYYQRKYGIVKHLQINKKGKFTIWNIHGDPLLVQPYKACFTNPAGGVDMSPRQYNAGCPVYIKAQICHDTWMMDDCYDHFLEWKNSGVDYTSEGEKIMDLHRDELMANSRLAMRGTQWIGQMFDLKKIEEKNLWADGMSEEKKELFRKTTQACRGLLPMTNDMSEKYAWMNQPECIDLSKWDLENCVYNGDLGQDIENIINKKLPRKLRKYVKSGRGPRNRGSKGMVFMTVSDPMYAIVQAEVLKEDKMFTLNQRCWEEVQVQVADGFETVIIYRKRLVIIPDTVSCIWDEYLKTTTLYMSIGVSDNIQMGTSFGAYDDDVESNLGNKFGMLLQKDTNINSANHGKWTWMMNSLLFQGILDPECYWGAYKIVEPLNHA